jgi:hypothetical protein
MSVKGIDKYLSKFQIDMARFVQTTKPSLFIYFWIFLGLAYVIAKKKKEIQK